MLAAAPGVGGRSRNIDMSSTMPTPRHCERSEAIQGADGRLDCFVAALLAMTE